MVPGSTLIYGSSLISVTRSPRASSKQPIEDAARPLPKLETTPPVTKMYLGILHSSMSDKLKFVGQFYLLPCIRSRFRRIVWLFLVIIDSMAQVLLDFN